MCNAALAEVNAFLRLAPLTNLQNNFSLPIFGRKVLVYKFYVFLLNAFALF